MTTQQQGPTVLQLLSQKAGVPEGGLITGQVLAALAKKIEEEPGQFLIEVVRSLMSVDSVYAASFGLDRPSINDPSDWDQALSSMRRPRQIPGPLRKVEITLTEYMTPATLPPPCNHEDAAVASTGRGFVSVVCPCGAEWEMNIMKTQDRWHVKANAPAMKR